MDEIHCYFLNFNLSMDDFIDRKTWRKLSMAGLIDIHGSFHERHGSMKVILGKLQPS